MTFIFLTYGPTGAWRGSAQVWVSLSLLYLVSSSLTRWLPNTHSIPEGQAEAGSAPGVLHMALGQFPTPVRGPPTEIGSALTASIVQGGREDLEATFKSALGPLPHNRRATKYTGTTK